MFKPSDEDDDMFFSVGPSSKLASLFDTSIVPDNSSNSNASLIYSAPKQPQTPKKSPLNQKPQSSVSLVKIVHAYKFVDNAYEPLGKCGLAFAEVPSSKQCSIILYKNKTKPIFNIKLNSNIKFIIQNDLYLTFYDENKQNWSLLFENIDDISQFENKLNLIGVKMTKTGSKSESKNQTANTIPTINMSLVQIYKLVNNHFQYLGEQNLRLENFDDKCKLILNDVNTHQGFNMVLDSNKGCSVYDSLYLDIVDDDKQKWLFLFNDINDINEFINKFSEIKMKVNKSNLSEEIRGDIDTKKLIPDEKDLTSTSQTKEMILSRLSKMGQHVMPFVEQLSDNSKSKYSIESSDKSTSTDDKSKAVTPANNIATRLKKKRLNRKSTDNLSAEPTITHGGNAITTYVPIFSNNSDGLVSILTENRSHNTEMRLNMLKLDTKLDKVLDRLYSSQEHTLSTEIKNLKLQNEQLKLDIEKINNKFQLNLNTNKENISNQTSHTSVQTESLFLPSIDVSKELENQSLIEKSTEEIETLKNKCLSTISTLETLQKKNALLEMKIKDLENFYFEYRPLPKTSFDHDDGKTSNTDLDEVYQQNSEIRKNISQMTDEIRECSIALQEQSCRIAELKACYNEINNIPSPEENIGLFHKITLKFKDLESYIIDTEKAKKKLEQSIAILKDYESQFHAQELKLSNIAENYSNLTDSCKLCISKDQEILNLKQQNEEISSKHSNEIDKLKGQISDLEKQLTNNTNIKSQITPIVKDKMNELYNDLQDKLKDENKDEVTSLIVQTTYKIINSINFQLVSSNIQDK